MKAIIEFAQRNNLELGHAIRMVESATEQALRECYTVPSDVIIRIDIESGVIQCYDGDLHRVALPPVISDRCWRIMWSHANRQLPRKRRPGNPMGALAGAISMGY